MPAQNACKGCFLVQVVQSSSLDCYQCANIKVAQYCSKDCQQAHWGVHKRDCRSPLMKNTWRPAWDVEGRQPAFITDKGQTVGQNPYGQTPYGGQKYLWGNVPALDLLNIKQNEGSEFTGDIRLLFAGTYRVIT